MTPRRVERQNPVASAEGWFRPCFTSHRRAVAAAARASTSYCAALEESPLWKISSVDMLLDGSHRRMVKALTLRPSASPLSLTVKRTSSRDLVVTRKRRSNRTAAFAVDPLPSGAIASSSSIAAPPPPSSVHDRPTITSARAPHAPTLALHSLLVASLMRASNVVSRCSVMAERDSAPPPVSPTQSTVICSRVSFRGSLHALSNLGMSLPRCGRRARWIS
mmetsp:Transcript_454/g.1084  ORF Transcript_454/g.1084 Transcript_454/m.1084 type:complete len:220 (+) Transcript_454:2029-2688(+)